ncbi:MAG: DUF3108 domain-containing protein [Bacteroidia bacterium]|nr:DUF3108 domain-containing protein [Bacteroidia bacterium]
MNIRLIYPGLLFLALLSIGWRGHDYRKIENHTFHRGEFLKFRIHYGLITAGFATLEVKEEKKIVKGRNCYHIVGQGFTNQAFDVVYKVRDYYETFMDEESLISLRFNRHIREGGFENYSETHFDHQKGKALYIDHKKRHTVYDVPPNIQDVISAFYFARTRYDQDSLKPGDRISLQNFLDRKNFGLEASLITREKIKIDGVWYKALKMNLLIEEAGLVTDGSTIVFWISDDDNKIPLRIQSELMIGSLKADLIEYQNLRNPFKAKI